MVLTGEEREVPPHESATLSAGLDCAACGYDLTGVEIGSHCPECGAAVADTIRAGRTTTRRQAVTVVLRLTLLLVVFSAWGMIDLLVWLVLALSGFSPAVNWDPDMGWYLVAQLFSMGVRVGIAVGVWCFAPHLSAWLVKHDGALAASSRISSRGVLSVGLVLIGVYAVIGGGAAILSNLVAGVADDYGFNNGYALLSAGEPALFASLAWFVCGLVLVASPGLRSWLGRDLPRT